MSPSSMTGFARTSFEAGDAKFSWELKSVNARGLEIRTRLPAGMDHLEPDIRQAARQKLARGSCFFTLQAEGAAEKPSLSINQDALALVLAAARRLSSEGFATASADGLLALPGVLQEGQPILDPSVLERRDGAILEGLETAIAALQVARAEEGRRLADILRGHLDTIASLTRQAAELSAATPEVLRKRIMDQVALLTADTKALDLDRLHQEAVLAATRADVREEIDRLNSHVTAARQLLAAGGNVGRRLDFLSQELNREANTLCSKAMDHRMSAVGVELKATIDQFREQVQNLE
jgi:uncharacterized protein (TIGR00255 family)